MERPAAYDSPTPAQIESDSAAEPQEVSRSWKDYVSITKVGINVANLWTTFAGLWLAGHGRLEGYTTVVTLAGTALVVGGGAALNNWIDRDIDRVMPRTAKRPLANGRIPAVQGLLLGSAISLAGLVLLAVGINGLTALTAFVGWFTYVIVYTLWLKRTTTLNTVVGGIAGAVPPLIGWAAVRGTLDPSAWILFLIIFLWQPPHFFALAMKRVEDYRAAGIPMLPVVRGFEPTRRQMLGYTVVLWPVSLLLFWTGAAGWLYVISAAILGGIYIGMSLWGFRTSDPMKWANGMFRYSLIYLMAICAAAIVGVE
ncbi:heme o synthase [Kyrpidia spormannii]|uniref:Protoheme IX farnesyltransferase 2 n=2 Tax=Kyrpidia spormannii TaxID=2055160 RepID=A0ACA8Z5T9_9BACL|nr:heme o synthase [Kyrpidia spormannii]CAB3390201.1 protoheme IX farnesyltransferase 2 [Kyrpidia spormannii]CAB3391123.1 protoheme IX farnesyltransferase 2 [Kyrpidia spormannii]